MPWLPTFASVLAAGLTAALLCPEPLSRAVTPGEAALRAALFVCLVGGATAVAARVFLARFFPEIGARAGWSALAHGGNGVWFAPLAIFLVQDRSLPVLGAALLGVATARLLRRWGSGMDEETPEESFSADRQMFSGVGSDGWSQSLFLAFTATVAMNVGLAVLAIGQTAAAAALAGAACFIVASLVEPVVPARRGSSFRRVWAGAAVRGLCATALATLGLIRIPVILETSGWANGNAAASSTGGNVAGKDLLSGAVLLAETPRNVRLIAPVQRRRPNVRPGRFARAMSIEFSGEYWICSSLLACPPSSSMVVRDTPITYNFTSVDRSPLMMQARQKLGSAIDPRCCSAIEVTVRNADRQPETIALWMALKSSKLPRGPFEELGFKNLPAGELAVLRFELPLQFRIRQFDEIVIRFDLAGRRMHRSANVAIERFVLVPWES